MRGNFSLQAFFIKWIRDAFADYASERTRNGNAPEWRIGI
jgi:hypothetical protein